MRALTGAEASTTTALRSGRQDDDNSTKRATHSKSGARHFRREGGKLSLRRAAIEQFGQPGEVDCHLSCFVDRHDAGVPCAARSPAIEHANLLPGGVLDGESGRHLDDTPWRWKAGGHRFFCLVGLRVIPRPPASWTGGHSVPFGFRSLNPRSRSSRHLAVDVLASAMILSVSLFT